MQCKVSANRSLDLIKRLQIQLPSAQPLFDLDQFHLWLPVPLSLPPLRHNLWTLLEWWKDKHHWVPAVARPDELVDTRGFG